MSIEEKNTQYFDAGIKDPAIVTEEPPADPRLVDFLSSNPDVVAPIPGSTHSNIGLRDLAALAYVAGLQGREASSESVCRSAYRFADEFLQARERGERGRK